MSWFEFWYLYMQVMLLETELSWQTLFLRVRGAAQLMHVVQTFTQFVGLFVRADPPAAFTGAGTPAGCCQTDSGKQQW